MRTIAILILALTASSVWSAIDTCTPNNNAFAKLLTDLTDSGFATTDVKAFSGVVTASATTVAKCGEYVLSTTQVCADQDKMVAAIDKYNAKLVADLAALATTRDKYILAQRGEVIKVLGSLRRINELATSGTVTGTYADMASLFVGFASEIAKNFTAIVEKFDTFQTSRQTCMNALVRSQSALICKAFQAYDAAALPPSLVFTVNSETAAFDNDFVNQIATACFPFFQQSVSQSAIIRTSVYSGGIARLVSAFEKLVAKNDAGAAEDFLAASTAFNASKISDTAAEKPVSLPSNCASGACAAFVDSLFDGKGILKKDDAIVGGTVAQPAIALKRFLFEEGNERRLAATGLDLDLTKYTGFAVDFAKNPGSVDNKQNSNSALRNGIVACAVAALALVF